ncbi:hypothetical protein ES708_28119 [subsurface metagenome]|jgi:hypothetical protein
MSSITYVKSSEITTAAADVKAEEINLGLSINEAARILGVELGAIAASATATAKVDLSFDPEDTAIDGADDEHFACVERNAFGTSVDSTWAFLYFDFTRMNLITTRNLALILETLVAGGTGKAKIYFEKYIPSAQDLNQLIAARR